MPRRVDHRSGEDGNNDESSLPTAPPLPQWLDEASSSFECMFRTHVRAVLREASSSILRRVLAVHFRRTITAVDQRKRRNIAVEATTTVTEASREYDDEVRLEATEQDVSTAYAAASRVGRRWADELVRAGHARLADVVRRAVRVGKFLEGGGGDEEDDCLSPSTTANENENENTDAGVENLPAPPGDDREPPKIMLPYSELLSLRRFAPDCDDIDGGCYGPSPSLGIPPKTLPLLEERRRDRSSPSAVRMIRIIDAMALRGGVHWDREMWGAVEEAARRNRIRLHEGGGVANREEKGDCEDERRPEELYEIVPKSTALFSRVDCNRIQDGGNKGRRCEDENNEEKQELEQEEWSPCRTKRKRRQVDEGGRSRGDFSREKERDDDEDDAINQNSGAFANIEENDDGVEGERRGVPSAPNSRKASVFERRRRVLETGLPSLLRATDRTAGEEGTGGKKTVRWESELSPSSKSRIGTPRRTRLIKKKKAPKVIVVGRPPSTIREQERYSWTDDVVGSMTTSERSELIRNMIHWPRPGPGPGPEDENDGDDSENASENLSGDRKREDKVGDVNDVENAAEDLHRAVACGALKPFGAIHLWERTRNLSDEDDDEEHVVIGEGEGEVEEANEVEGRRPGTDDCFLTRRASSTLAAAGGGQMTLTADEERAATKARRRAARERAFPRTYVYSAQRTKHNDEGKKFTSKVRRTEDQAGSVHAGGGGGGKEEMNGTKQGMVIEEEQLRRWLELDIGECTIEFEIDDDHRCSGGGGEGGGGEKVLMAFRSLEIALTD